MATRSRPRTAASKPVDLAKTRVKWDALAQQEATADQLLAAIEQARWDIARDLWTAWKVDGLSQEDIGYRTGRKQALVSRWARVYDRRDEFSARGLTFNEASQEVKTGLADKVERGRRQDEATARRFIKKASTDEKADLVVDTLKDNKVVEAVSKKLDKEHKEEVKAEKAQRKAEQDARLEATFTERDKAVLGRNGNKAQAEAIAQIATGQDEPDDNAMYTDEDGNVYNHDYEKDNPKSPFIKTHNGSKVNWHSPVLCETPLPDELIDGIENNVGMLMSPMYTLGARDKRRLRAVLSKGLEATK